MATHDIHCRSGNESLPVGPAFSQVPEVAGRSRIYLLPGELKASKEPAQITTILGSCVAVCLWDTHNRVGGMNHFLLPAWREGEGSSTRFGDIATQTLLQRLLELGCQKRHLTAKLFGGSALFRPQSGYATSLGAKNVDAARTMMANAGIPVIAQDTGGTHGRKLIFHTDDGAAWSRQV